MTSKKDKVALRNKILKGLKKTYENLVESKKLRNEDLVVLKNDKIVHLKP